jgi:hypothetical protein
MPRASAVVAKNWRLRMRFVHWRDTDARIVVIYSGSSG